MRSCGRWAGVSLLTLLVVGLTSCGSNAPVALPDTGASMEGVVTYDGKTLYYGQVNVVGAADSAQGAITRDGTYKVERAPLGPVKISVITDPGMAQADRMSGGMYKGPDAKGAGKAKVEYVDVPKKYQNFETSGLTFTVERGTNKIDIAIPK